MSAADRNRAKVETAAQPFLSQGERLYLAVPAQTVPPAWLMAIFAICIVASNVVRPVLGYVLGGALAGVLAVLLFSLVNRNRVILCTDQRIAVLACGWTGPRAIRSVLAEFRTDAPVRITRGWLAARAELPGQKLYVARLYQNPLADLFGQPAAPGHGRHA